MGHPTAKRGSGFAGNYVEAIGLRLQQDQPNDYIAAIGRTHGISRILDLAVDRLDRDWRAYVKIDLKSYRPATVDRFQGDASMARRIIGWTPKVDLQGLVAIMIKHDRELAGKDRLIETAARTPLEGRGTSDGSHR